MERDDPEVGSAMFAPFFTLSLDLMCICSSDGYFKRVNPAFQRILGYSEEELLAAPLLDFMHPDDRPRTSSNLQRLGRGETTAGSENRYRCTDGSYRWFAWNSTPGPDGAIYAIGRDVTEQKRVTEELRRARELAEAANRELEAFSYTVAHDLRAPLRSVDGFSLALLEDYADELDGDAKHMLERVRAGAQRMSHLIDDLLALARLSRAALNVHPVDLTRLARDIVGRLHEAHPERVVDVRIEEGLSARADVNLLADAIENLIGNAWKYTSKTHAPVIEVSARGEGQERAFFVRDNGAGFDMAYAERLFAPFQRLHRADEFEGTGIGLASVHRIIRRHGGRIWPEAAVGQGATFYFTLPDEPAEGT
jgi:PAS domain S-box-containing protein